jgi:RND family efflux transporter MFP subunit
MTQRHKHVAFGAVLTIVVGTALGVTAYRLAHTVQADARIVKLPLPVQTVPAKVQVLHETIGAAGIIQPSMPVTLTAKVVSKVLKVPVDLGAVVRRGQVLVQLDRRLFEANLAEARAAYDHAHKQRLRMKALVHKRFGSAVDLEKASMAEAAARDAVVRAEIDVANTRTVSPIAGVVLERNINPGEITSLDQHLIVLGMLDPVMMVAQVSEDRLGSVYVGMKAAIGTDAFPGAVVTGNVAKIDFRVNEQSRTFPVYVRIENHGLRLTKGVTGYCRLESTLMALAIPATALMNPVGDRATVFVVGTDHKVHLRNIRPGPSVEGMTEVLGGLQENDQVVTAGQFGLHDDDAVTVNRFAPWNKTPTKQAAQPTAPGDADPTLLSKLTDPEKKSLEKEANHRASNAQTF